MCKNPNEMFYFIMKVIFLIIFRGRPWPFTVDTHVVKSLGNMHIVF